MPMPPQADMQMPPDMGMEPPQEGFPEGAPPQDMEGPQGQGMEAGADSDEEEDPKRLIQQLAGKLSQELRSYNGNLPQPDADLNKYVAGMVNKQAMKGLTQDDAKEIVDKISGDADGGRQDESASRRGKPLREMFQDLTDDGIDQDDGMQRSCDRDTSYTAMPFTTPRFE